MKNIKKISALYLEHYVKKIGAHAKTWFSYKESTLSSLGFIFAKLSHKNSLKIFVLSSEKVTFPLNFMDSPLSGNHHSEN